jgi:UDP-N-acetylglucosamine--N-acetylmuramyl-(pentapeptide) pyrophosphoryl-undecaprenol N-acetylglucosamine transferase
MTGAAPRKIVLAAGGTGGHMFPAQALARELLSRGCEVVLVTDQRGAGFGPELPQVETYRISAGGVAGSGLLRKLKGLASLALGFFQARRLLKGLGAEVVVGFGGYPSVPTVFAGSRAGLRIVIHEQNAVAGRANRLLAPRAHVIATCFDRVKGLRKAERRRAAVTGNPVRAAIAELGRRPYGVPGETDPLTVIVVGGSQGARVFNTVVPEAIRQLPEALRRRIRLSQQVPGEAIERIGAIYRECGVAADLAGFFDDLPTRLAAAHLVICRAGASTTAELAAAGRPAILVPYPTATDDHQTANARALVDAGAAWLLPESSLTAQTLAERLESLLGTPALLTRAAHCAAAVARHHAAERLADLVLAGNKCNGETSPSEETGKEAAA